MQKVYLLLVTLFIVPKLIASLFITIIINKNFFVLIFI